MNFFDKSSAFWSTRVRLIHESLRYLFYTIYIEKEKNVYNIYALSTDPPIDNKIEPIKMQEYVEISEDSAFALLVTKITVILPIQNLHMPVYMYNHVFHDLH